MRGKRWLQSLSCFIAVAFSSSCLAAVELLEDLARLDTELAELSSDFYQDRSRYSREASRRTNSVAELQTWVEAHFAKSDEIAAIQLLHTNKPVVMNNLEHRAIFGFLGRLLENNEREMADRIAEAIRQDGDRTLIAGVNFIFAKYYAERNAWDQVHELLAGGFSELSAGDSAYAYLLDGVALQHLKQHRPAIEQFSKVPAPSKYYPEAQLNMAVASVRQDWWTDADLILKKLLRNAPKPIDLELADRVHLVLGYALLQRGFNRNARDEFRKIRLGSRYANRALLGIGVAATSQGDYVGAVNAFTVLRKQDSRELSVEESYLLLPYVYSKVGQEVTVTAGYTEAQNHYQKRIEELEKLAANQMTFSPDQYDSDTGTLHVGDNRLAYGDMFPRAFLKNFSLLKKLAVDARNTRMSGRFNALLTKYEHAYQEVSHTLLEARIAHLRSYLNQARYGLANFFDHPGGASDNE